MCSVVSKTETQYNVFTLIRKRYIQLTLVIRGDAFQEIYELEAISIYERNFLLFWFTTISKPKHLENANLHPVECIFVFLHSVFVKFRLFKSLICAYK